MIKLRIYQKQWDNLFKRNRKVLIIGARQIGKDFFAAYKSVIWALETKKDVLVLNDGLKKSQSFLQTTKNMVEVFEEYLGQSLLSDKRKGSRTILTFKNGAQILALPAKEKAAVGFSGHVIWNEIGIMDVDEQKMYDWTIPVISSNENLNFLMISNATPENTWLHNFLFSEEMKDLRKNWEVASTNIYDAYGANLPESVQEAMDTMSESAVKRWYLNHWIGTSDVFRNISFINSFQGEAHSYRILSVDPGGSRDAMGFVVLCQKLDGNWVVEHCERRWDVPYNKMSDWIMDKKVLWNASKICIDPGGPGYPVWQDLVQRLGEGIVIKTPWNSSSKSVDSCIQKLENGNISLSEKCEDLVKELKVISRNGNKLILPRFKVDGGFSHCDIAVALIQSADHLDSYFQDKTESIKRLKKFNKRKGKNSFVNNNVANPFAMI